MAVFILSLGGFPPMGGFIAKWYVFSAAVKAGYTWLAIIGVLTSVVSVFFYLRIVVMMYRTPTERPAAFPAVPRIAGLALVQAGELHFRGEVLTMNGGNHWTASRAKTCGGDAFDAAEALGRDTAQEIREAAGEYMPRF